MSNIWPDDRKEQLTALWTSGLAASAIAAKLGGLTRCAVISAIHRFGLKRETAKLSWRQQVGHGARSKQTREQRAAKQRHYYAEKRIAEGHGPPHRTFPWARQPLPPAPPPPGGGPSYYILDIPDGGCKFAVTGHNVAPDEHRFCGLPVAGAAPWCAYHTQLVYKPMEGRG